MRVNPVERRQEDEDGMKMVAKDIVQTADRTGGGLELGIMPNSLIEDAEIETGGTKMGISQQSQSCVCQKLKRDD